MPLTISDRALDEVRKTAPETLVELACRLYTADEISKPQATKLAGLARVDFEAELTKRGLPWIRITGDDYLEQESRGARATTEARQARQGIGT